MSEQTKTCGKIGCDKPAVVDGYTGSLHCWSCAEHASELEGVIGGPVLVPDEQTEQPMSDAKPKTCVCGDTEGTNDDCERCTLLSHLAAALEQPQYVKCSGCGCGILKAASKQGTDGTICIDPATCVSQQRTVDALLDCRTDDGCGECLKCLKAELAAAQQQLDTVSGALADAGDVTTAVENVRTVVEQRDEARIVVRETLWMAGRYADGRATYAVEMYNSARQKAVDGGYAGDAKEAIDGHDPGRATLQERAEIAETAGSPPGAAAMSQEQCCGTCKWWRRLMTEPLYGACICALELPSRQPIAVYISTTRRSTHEQNGTDCPTWERREGA